MVSGGHPDTLNARHKAIALMIATGWKQRDIAEELDLTEARVSVIASSPLFRVQVDEIRKKIREGMMGAVDDVNEAIRAEAGPTLRKLVDLRDHAEGENVQLGAANSIFDRAVPKITRHETDHSLHLHITREEIQTMREVAGEVGEAIDVEALPPFRIDGFMFDQLVPDGDE